MNGHGGPRVGAGAKPRRGRFVPAIVEGGLSSLAQAPDDLPEDQRAFWDRWARHAIEAGTLNERTEAGFRLLCSLEARMRRWDAVIAAEGDTFQKVTVDGAGQEQTELKAHPLVAKHLVVANKVDALMGRFMLTAFGKPATGGRPKQAQPSKWAAVAGA